MDWVIDAFNWWQHALDLASAFGLVVVPMVVLPIAGIAWVVRALKETLLR